MDKAKAKKILLEHKEALGTLLESEGLGDIESDLQEIRDNAREGSRKLKKTLVGRLKEIPIVDKVSQLGTAGTVAVATAGTAQVNIATDLTTVFVAEVANDIVEERFEVPVFVDNFIDFEHLNDWGQNVLIEKVSEAQTFVSEVSEQRQISIQNTVSKDSKSETLNASDTVEEKSSDEKSEPKEQPQETEKEIKEEKSSEEKEEVKEDSPKEDKEDKLVKDQEPKTEDKKQSEQKTPLEEIKEEDKAEVKENVEKVETPDLETMNPIRPHDMVEPSPVQ
jgi:flagellar biosynthesis GTPase FlhF